MIVRCMMAIVQRIARIVRRIIGVGRRLIALIRCIIGIVRCTIELFWLIINDVCFGACVLRLGLMANVCKIGIAIIS
jgi:hypothetical protein